jgi:hypothetical protein
MAAKQGRKIALVGASGTVGRHTLAAFLASAIHTITVVTRSKSKAVFPEGVIINKGDYGDESFLEASFTGQDVLILMLGREALQQQTPLIAAAVQAGVPWIVPTDFGSDPMSEKLRSHIPPRFLDGKDQYHTQVEESSSSNWIGIINNPWFDWCLTNGFWGINIKDRKATLYNGGNTKVTTTTLDRVGKGVAGVFSLPDSELAKFKNQYVYLSSFRVSQRDMLESVLRATETEESDWDVNTVAVADAVKQGNELAAQGNMMGLVTAFFAPHFEEGLGGDFSEKLTDPKLLGLEEEEELDAVVKRVVEELKARHS